MEAYKNSLILRRATCWPVKDQHIHMTLRLYCSTACQTAKFSCMSKKSEYLEMSRYYNVITNTAAYTVFGVANSMWVDICLHDRCRNYMHPTFSQRIVARTVQSMPSLPYPIFSSFVAACENALLIWYSDRTCTNNTKNIINYCINEDLFVMQSRSLSFANLRNQ